VVQRRSDEQQGQVVPALLLVVVSLLFLGFAFAQYGSAGNQSVQIQTAADSAAVAGAHRLRDATLSSTVQEELRAAFPFGAAMADGLAVVEPVGLQTVACAAATTNWAGNPHRSGLGCGGVEASADAGSVSVHVVGPAGEVADGPAQVEGMQFQANATARVVVGDCPVISGSVEGRAVADWIAQSLAESLGTPAPSCWTPQDSQVVEELLLLPPAQQLAAIGPAQPLVVAVTQGVRVEIVH